MFTIEKIELKDGNGVKWSAMRDWDGDYSCFRNGDSAFSLEISDDGEKYTVRNDAPHSSQYRTRKQFLCALAEGKFVGKKLATTTATEQPSLTSALMWAIVQYKNKGWRTRDCFSESLTMLPAKKFAA